MVVCNWVGFSVYIIEWFISSILVWVDRCIFSMYVFCRLLCLVSYEYCMLCVYFMFVFCMVDRIPLILKTHKNRKAMLKVVPMAMVILYMSSLSMSVIKSCS